MRKLTIKFNSYLRYINISYYLKFQKPMCHRQFLRVIPQKRDYVEKKFMQWYWKSFSFCMSE